MGAREYDPSLGRFISADPLTGDPTVPQQLSRYPYVGNDPLARYDLSGLSWLDDIGATAISVGEAFVGTVNDYENGGIPALESDWWNGFSSMSTKGKIADLALPAAPIAALSGAEFAGVGGAVVWGGETLSAEVPEVVDLLEREGPECEIDATTKLAEELKFTETIGAHMEEAGRYFPRHLLAEAIEHGERMPDPEGVEGTIKIEQQVFVNGKEKTLEIIYRESDQTILHFMYK